MSVNAVTATNTYSANTKKETVSAMRATTWTIDSAHASALFKVRHLMVASVRGQMGPVSGTLVLDEQDLTRSRVEVSIDARQLDTRDAKRDEHLRSGDFFDVARFPTVTFKSTQVTIARGGELLVTGDLTIRDVTRPVTLQVEALPPAVSDPWGNVKRGAAARATVNRSDFGLTWNLALETGGLVVGDKVEIEIEVELVKARD
jgi:polyisoprenoid-binding protein YceI